MPISNGNLQGDFNQGAVRAVQKLNEYDRAHGGKLGPVLATAHAIVTGSSTTMDACDLTKLRGVIRTIQGDDPKLKEDMGALKQLLGAHVTAGTGPRTCSPSKSTPRPIME